MADSSTSIPHVTIDFEVEMDSLIDLRDRVNQQNPDNKVSFNDFYSHYFQSTQQTSRDQHHLRER